MVLNTHLKIDETLSGDMVELRENYARIELQTVESMVADEQGLVHGGFVFSAADYAAMACVNHPNVVLAKSEVKFLAPVKLGQNVVLEATKLQEDAKRISVEVIGKVEEKDVFKGTFYTAVLDKHVLEL